MTKFFKTLILLIVLTNNSFGQITVGLLQHNGGTLDDGYVLFAPTGSTSTYLIDKCGRQVKTWPGTYKPGQSCYILPDGSLLRAGNTNNTTFNAGGKGGIIEKIDWSGTVTWSYTISSTTECQHHDIKSLPNGNVLAIVWEAKTNTEAIAEGRNPSLTTTTVWSEKIVEIQPVGLTGGNVVWEWHLWDHLVQDSDNTKSNYGNVSSNPQLININYSASSNPTTGQDWIHLNSIDYNDSLDQILVSSHSFDEIWIIDHSTTTAQAAIHTGGNSNKGGDLLYRWGNPQAYNNGTVADQKFFGQHNAHWIESGLPYQNHIMVFNNGNGRPGGNYSTVEIINPPLAGFNYAAKLPYLPASTSWIYNNTNLNSIYASNISGAQQLPTGNVLLCEGPSGVFREVDSLGTTLWKYINPVSTTGIINQGSSPLQNIVFRCIFYSTDYVGFMGQTLTPTTIIENSNTNSANCTLALGIENGIINENTIRVYPNPTNQFLNIELENDFPNILRVEIIDNLGRIMYKDTNLQQLKSYSINVSEYPNGVYFVLCKFKNRLIARKIVIE